MRRGEVCAMLWSEVNLSEGYAGFFVLSQLLQGLGQPMLSIQDINGMVESIIGDWTRTER